MQMTNEIELRDLDDDDDIVNIDALSKYAEEQEKIRADAREKERLEQETAE